MNNVSLALPLLLLLTFTEIVDLFTKHRCTDKSKSLIVSSRRVDGIGLKLATIIDSYQNYAIRLTE